MLTPTPIRLTACSGTRTGYCGWHRVSAMDEGARASSDRIVDKTGHIRGSVLVFVNEEDIRFLQNESTPLKDGDEISIVPAFAGG